MPSTNTQHSEIDGKHRRYFADNHHGRRGFSLLLEERKERQVTKPKCKCPDDTFTLNTYEFVHEEFPFYKNTEPCERTICEMTVVNEVFPRGRVYLSFVNWGYNPNRPPTTSFLLLKIGGKYAEPIRNNFTQGGHIHDNKIFSFGNKVHMTFDIKIDTMNFTSPRWTAYIMAVRMLNFRHPTRIVPS